MNNHLKNEDTLKKFEKIDELKEKRDAVILAHNYQPPEIQDVADFVGDSFELSKEAAELDNETIVFCGVHFMAESAYILAPEKTVLLPEKTSGCPLADMANKEQLAEKKKNYPNASVVAYVNSTAEIKAQADICCTSSNAVEVVNSLETDNVLFLPDKNLADYISRHTDKNIIPWEGYCPSHVEATSEEIDLVRNNFPGAPILCHPECPPHVKDRVDHIMGTGGIVKFARETYSEKIIIGTEVGLIHRLKKENPEKDFILLSQSFYCPDMKKTNLDNLISSLENMENVITVDQETTEKAKDSLIKMLEARGESFDRH